MVMERVNCFTSSESELETELLVKLSQNELVVRHETSCLQKAEQEGPVIALVIKVVEQVLDCVKASDLNHIIRVSLLRKLKIICKSRHQVSYKRILT